MNVPGFRTAASHDLRVITPDDTQLVARDSHTTVSDGTAGGSSMPLLLRESLPALILLLVVTKVVSPVSDPDTFWHIAAGDYLSNHWVFNGPDPWSDMSTHTWRLHEWLPQLGISGLYDLGGLAAVAWVLPLGVTAIMVALWYWLRQTSSLLVTALVMGATFVGMTASMSARPHLVSFAFTVVTTGAWLRTATDHRGRWWLVPLTWVWACSHGMWFVAPVIGVTVVVGMALDRGVGRRQLVRLAGIPVVSVVAAALTPVGPQLLLSPLEVSVYTSFVDEWQASSLGDQAFTAFMALAGLVAVMWCRRGQRVPWSQLLLLALAVGLALMYARTVAVGAAVLAPVAATTIKHVKGTEREPGSRRERVITLGAALVALVAAAVMSSHSAARPAAGANELDAELSALPSGTTVCNSYDLGGWLIWRHPNIRPAVDGRTEVYALDYFHEYLAFHSGRPGWESYLDTVGCTHALVRTTEPAAAGLAKQEGWIVVRAGEQFVLLRAPE